LAISDTIGQGSRRSWAAFKELQHVFWEEEEGGEAEEAEEGEEEKEEGKNKGRRRWRR